MKLWLLRYLNIIIFIFPTVACAYFGDEFDLALFPQGTKIMTGMQIGSAGMLDSKKISNITTIEGLTNQEAFISLSLNNQRNIGFSFKHGKTEVERSIQPKTLDTRAYNYRLWIGTDPWQKWQWRGYINHQATDKVKVQCYEMASRIIGGSCLDAEFTFLDPNRTNNDDGSLNTVPVLNTKVIAKTIGIEFRRELIANKTMRLSSQVRLQRNHLKHDITSPLFSMRSPVFLGFVLNGKPLKEIRDNFRQELPQSDPWYEDNFSLGINTAHIFKEFISIGAGLAYTKITRSDYKESVGRKEITNNLRFDLSMIWAFKENNALFMKGFITTNNVLGYEPIAYNRKSSSQFDKEYGEIAIGILKFW